jgi:hypothetical protein
LRISTCRRGEAGHVRQTNLANEQRQHDDGPRSPKRQRGRAGHLARRAKPQEREAGGPHRGRPVEEGSTEINVSGRFRRIKAVRNRKRLRGVVRQDLQSSSDPELATGRYHSVDNLH